jgi:hypothetical protein
MKQEFNVTPMVPSIRNVKGEKGNALAARLNVA